MPLWLVGMMGSGKSTVGRLVAERLGCDFVDTDELVATHAGVAAADLLTADPVAFRSAEAEAVAGVALSEAVVATGGGVVLDDGSVEVMRSSGLVVWLDAPVEVLARRVGLGEGRPLLGSDPLAAIERLLQERRARYQQAAHVTVEASTPAGVVAVLVATHWEASRVD
ncbi:MAG TPA: shikimate kinase [Acidimicrobiia bacterium]|nr:shikimate kinase [Acidimicrobiia bacterium]